MQEQMKQILELFSQPAFFVRDGIVCWCNGAARSLLEEGTALSSLLEGGDTLFSHWDRTGTLMLPLMLGGRAYDASVRAAEDGTLFVANRCASDNEASASALFSASVSLRKPLHAMVSAADELFERLGDASGAEDAAARLNQSIYQFIRLCNQMSDGSELLLHRKTLRRAPTDMGAFLESFVNEAAPLVSSADRTLEYTPLVMPISADADTELLQRALYNLLANALSYTPKGGAVRLSVRKEDDLLLITVSDSGSGISQELLSSLFDRFNRQELGDSRRGIGLGLSITREIARLHDGTLTVTSGENGGAVVSFSLSLKKTALPLHATGIVLPPPRFHRGLVELSEVLGAKMYDPNEVP
ncbi:MAG: sensor histidine kinase [Oscillospiraceae bacterium]|nr:sensor histidine kinase [Oscillospiraceae bacterium]